jgi:cell division protein FtsI (penicillin-binding protein 3)
VAVALDPRTGEILAMASVPSINPNDPNSVRERGVRNRAVTDPVEPGSTMKPFSIGAAIEAGAIKVDQEWDCEGGKWKLGKATLHDAHPEGTLTTTQVLARSSNICTAKIARRAGRDTVSQFLRKMGFGAQTGVDLPGERAGQLRQVAGWGEVTLATIAFGQGMTATPLQIAAGLSAYANGGVLYRPHVVQKVLDSKGAVVVDVKPEGRRVVSPEVARTMRQMMRAVMQKKGTGEKLDIPGYPVAGKTGTAQKVDPATRHYSPKYWASSFVGFAPYEDPRLLLYVMVDEPQGSHYGGEVAGPIFTKVMSAALPYLGVAPQNAAGPAVAAADKPAEAHGHVADAAVPPAIVAEAADLDAEEKGDAEQGAPGQPGEEDGPGGDGPRTAPDRVPEFRGLGLGEALVLSQKAGLRLEVSGSGTIVSQVPAAGSLRKGPVCQVRLAPPP